MRYGAIQKFDLHEVMGKKKSADKLLQGETRWWLSGAKKKKTRGKQRKEKEKKKKDTKQNRTKYKEEQASKATSADQKNQ